MVRLNVAWNVGLGRHSFDVFTSRLNLTKVKNRNKSDLETLASGVYPVEGCLAEAQLRLPIKITEFLTVANGLLCLASTDIHSSQALSIPAIVSAVRTVTGRWKDH